MNSERPKRRFQFRLSTVLFSALSGGVLIYANFFPIHDRVTMADEANFQVYGRYPTVEVIRYGWPETWKQEHYRIDDGYAFLTNIYKRALWQNMGFDIVTLCGITVVFEYLSRHRDRQHASKNAVNEIK